MGFGLSRSLAGWLRSLHCGLQVQSTMGTVSLENVAAAGKGAGTPLLIFQLYVLSDRELTRSLVQRAPWAPSPAPGRGW